MLLCLNRLLPFQSTVTRAKEASNVGKTELEIRASMAPAAEVPLLSLPTPAPSSRRWRCRCSSGGCSPPGLLSSPSQVNPLLLVLLQLQCHDCNAPLQHLFCSGAPCPDPCPRQRHHCHRGPGRLRCPPHLAGG